MSTYQANWNAAKAKFEKDTTMKKPSDRIKVGIGKLSVSFKKYTGIENALKKVDELMSAKATEGAGASETKALEKRNQYAHEGSRILHRRAYQGSR